MDNSKKHKKNRKKEKKHQKSRSESKVEKDSDSSDEWIENTPNKTRISERDEWMDFSSAIPTFSNSELKANKGKLHKKEENELRSLDRPGQHERELNPYWKDGGKGVPMEEKTLRPKTTIPSCSVGDGGLDWLSRAYRRVIEQAKDEGKTPEEVAAPRWGSLEKLEALLREAEKKAGYRGRDRNEYRHKPSASFSGNRMFRRPQQEDELSSSSSRYSQQKSQYSKPRWQKSGVDQDIPRYESSKSSRPAETSTHQPTDNQFKRCDPDRAKRTKKHSDSEEDAKEPEKNRKAELKTIQVTESKPETLSKKEMNELGAKMLKAEILGNMELANKLKARLQAATEEPSEGVSRTTSQKQEVVILTETNSQGLSRPLVGSSTSSDLYGGKKGKKLKLQTHRDGERVCYFQDDDKYSLKQMFEKEKFNTVDDETAMYLKMAAGKERLKTDDDFTIDDIFVNKQARYEPEERQTGRHRDRVIKDHRKLNAVMDNCPYCFESKAMQKHLIVAVGSKVFLSLPNCQSLEEGHCYIVPMTHVPAATHLDEDVWNEVQMFRRTLTQMFKSQEKDSIFLETSLHLRRQPHAYIECVPLSLELGCMAPMYFKKAILESETEWAQNKKLVDLSKKDIRHSVPKGLPYFSVDFGLEGGFAHVVEDEQLFPDYFGREILGGMLDVEPRLWQKPRKENIKYQSQKVLAFEKWWSPFDCTIKS